MDLKNVYIIMTNVFYLTDIFYYIELVHHIYELIVTK